MDETGGVTDTSLVGKVTFAVRSKYLQRGHSCILNPKFLAAHFAETMRPEQRLAHSR